MAATTLSVLAAGGALAAKPVPYVTVVCAFYPGETTVTWTAFHGVRATIEFNYRDFAGIAHDVTNAYDKLKDHSLSVASPDDMVGPFASGTATATVWDRNGNSYSDSATCT